MWLCKNDAGFVPKFSMTLLDLHTLQTSSLAIVLLQLGQLCSRDRWLPARLRQLLPRTSAVYVQLRKKSKNMAAVLNTMCTEFRSSTIRL